MFNNLVCSSERIDTPTILGLFWGRGNVFPSRQSNRSVRKNSRIKCFVGKANYPHNRIERRQRTSVLYFCFVHIYLTFYYSGTNATFGIEASGCISIPQHPITFYSKILRSIGLPVVVHTCFASLSAGLYVKKPACLSP